MGLVDQLEEDEQRRLHEAIENALSSMGDLDGLVLTGWVVVFETAGEDAHAGHFYGPREMTTWRALGLLEWARRFNLLPDEDE